MRTERAQRRAVGKRKRDAALSVDGRWQVEGAGRRTGVAAFASRRCTY